MGIGSTSIGVVAGTKLALSTGIMKAGVLGILKAAGAAVISTTGLPLVLGIGVFTYFSHEDNQDKMKLKCKRIIKIM